MGPLPDALRVLQVEDADDAAVVARALRRGGLSLFCQRVDSALALRTALREAKWDLVISDRPD